MPDFRRSRSKLRVVSRFGALAAAAVLASAAVRPAGAAEPKRVGSVDTTFRVLGRNDRIVIERYDDPRVDGVSCYLSRAETGGISGTVGLATDPSRFSIACRSTGSVHVPDNLPPNETVFDASASAFFKEIRISRIYDPEKRVLVYLVWSTQSLSKGGSPYNSITAVPVQP
jgi:CreA protein